MAHVAPVVHNAGIDAIRPITAYHRRTKGTSEKNFDTGRAFLLYVGLPTRGHRGVRQMSDLSPYQNPKP
jgi:hypothetical protein